MCAQSASTLAVYWLGYWTCNLAVKSLISRLPWLVLGWATVVGWANHLTLSPAT